MQNFQTLTQSKFPTGFRFLILLSFLSLISFVLIKESVGTSINRIPELIYSLLFLSILCTRKWMIQKDLGSQYFVGSIILVFALLGVNYLQVGEDAIELFSATQLIKLTFFVVMGFWLGGRLDYIYIFLFASALGMMVALFQVDVVIEFKRIFAGKRVDFNIHNAQHISMYFGLILIGILSVFPKLIRMNYKSWKVWVLWLILSVFLIVSCLILVGAQTRAAWIGLVVILAVFTISQLLRLDYKKLILLIVLAITTLSFAWSFSATLQKRINIEAKVVELFIDEGLDSVPYTSIGTRLHTWDVALKKIAEKPIVGFGAKVRQSVIQNSEKLPANIKKRFGHFHNSYIEFTLAYGLVGLIFMLSIFVWVNIRIFKLSRDNKDYLPIWYFTFYGTVFMAVINVFESYVFFLSGVFAMSVLLAPAYSLHLADIYQKKVNNQVE